MMLAWEKKNIEKRTKKDVHHLTKNNIKQYLFSRKEKMRVFRTRLSELPMTAISMTHMKAVYLILSK